MSYQEFFRGKKVTQLGLGLLGRGLNDAIFMLENGVADLIVTDKKSAEELAPSVAKLREARPSGEGLKLVLGEHSLEDFSAKGGSAFGGEGPDFILKGAGVPLDSLYIAHAKEKGIPIEMDASLFMKLLPEGVTTIGVTGTRGKSTVTHLIAHILKQALGSRKLGFSNTEVLVGGNIRDMATLPLLKEVKAGDYVVLELDSWQLQGFGESKISPHVAVFTNFMPDHLNYYGGDMEKYFEDKTYIFRYQKNNDFLIVGEDVESRIKNQESRKITAKKTNILTDWKIKIPGEHNLANIACAVEVCKVLGITEEDIKKGVESFGGVEGRLQFVKEIDEIKIYNDNNSTTPEATIAGLRALGNRQKKNIVLIMGGDDKKLDMSDLLEEIPKWCSKVILFKESGTDTVKKKIFEFETQGLKVYEEEGLEATVKKALSVTGPGEIILYSPAFSSFGKYFKNEFDRNDQFMEIISHLS